MIKYFSVCIFCLVWLFLPYFCWTQEETRKDEEVEKLKERVQELEKKFSVEKNKYETELKTLKEKIDELLHEKEMREEEKLKKPLIEEKPTSAPQQQESTIGRAIQSFNPNVSIIGDFIAHAANHSNENPFSVRQLELAFSASVDPYARADVFTHIEKEEDGEWGIELCEGYVTFLTLPYDLQAKIGKFKSAFGKAGRLHLHAMPWVDSPIVITNFLGEEGLSEPGISTSWLVPNPWDKYIELTLEVQDNGFGGQNLRVPMVVGHLKNFFDITENSTFEIGTSFATGKNENEGRTNLEGLDLTYKWKPLKEGKYKSLTFQNEFLFSQKDQLDSNTENSWGMYSSLEYQFAERWSIFSRFDYSEMPDDSKSNKKGYSLGLTFEQSEYCFWRLQFEHTDFSNFSNQDYNNQNEVWLQLNFGMGPHRAHTY